MAVTIKDIARAAGVSNAMVSRALTGSGPVAPDKKKKIMDLADALGYVPNQMAISLRKSRTYTIGLYFSSINRSTSPYVVHQVLIGVYEIFRQDYNVLIKGIDMHKPGTLNPSYYDGLLVMSQWDSDIEFLEEAWIKGIPMVALGRKIPMNAPYVITDESGGVTKAMDYLLDQGHRKIGVIEGPQNLDTTIARHAGWWKAMKNRNLSPELIPVEMGNFRYRSGKAAALQLLERNPELTAILCFSDEMALGAKDAATSLGIRVPENLSLTGYDNWDFAGHSDACLTTVERNTIRIASEGAKLLLQYIETGNPPDSVYLENKLVIRESVKPCK